MWSNIKEILFNPFRRIGGWQSLMLGILVSVTTATIAFYSNIHFPDVISIKNGADFPFLFLLLQSIANWFVFASILFLAGLILRKTNVRFIDVLGNQALARYPFIIAALIGIIPGSVKFAEFIMHMQLGVGEPVQIEDYEIGLAVMSIFLMLLISIWSITLMYKAFAVSVNVKGWQGIVGFIISIFISIILTQLFSGFLYKHSELLQF